MDRAPASQVRAHLVVEACRLQNQGVTGFASLPENRDARTLEEVRSQIQGDHHFGLIRNKRLTLGVEVVFECLVGFGDVPGLGRDLELGERAIRAVRSFGRGVGRVQVAVGYSGVLGLADYWDVLLVYWVEYFGKGTQGCLK